MSDCILNLAMELKVDKLVNRSGSGLTYRSPLHICSAHVMYSVVMKTSASDCLHQKERVASRHQLEVLRDWWEMEVAFTCANVRQIESVRAGPSICTNEARLPSACFRLRPSCELSERRRGS